MTKLNTQSLTMLEERAGPKAAFGGAGTLASLAGADSSAQAVWVVAGA